MSYIVPDRINQEFFKDKIIKKLKHKEFENIGYEVLVENSFDFNADTKEYILNRSASEEVIAKINFVFKRIGFTNFDQLDELAKHFRQILEMKKYILVFAYNGTGKTRLSTEFKNIGKKKIINNLITENGDTIVDENGNNIVSEETTADTLYYNAFTEDLFTWDNDLENDSQRVLKLNKGSRFFNGLRYLEMESRIRSFLGRYADLDFEIDYDDWSVSFLREIKNGDTTYTIENIKVSRGEENIFIWCFFLAVAQLAIDKDIAYNWVKFIYIDDPISSLDDNNAIGVASHLAQMLKKQNDIKIVISTHHALFFNVMYNELKMSEKYFLTRNKNGEYSIKNTSDTPFFHHVALLKDMHEVAESGIIYTYHFNILRNIIEKTSSFLGFNHFSEIVKKDDDDIDGIIHKRYLDLLSHGNYSIFEPKEMNDENKGHFKKILKNFMSDYQFNPELFPEERTQL